MRKNFQILIIAIIVILIAALIGAYMMFMPQYKQIEINGYSFEVPSSDNNVTSINDNYKTYDDKQHNLSIKSYAINNINETNTTGAYDMGVQLGSGLGQNTTIENKTVLNQSGKYTYFDVNTLQMMVVTCDDYDTMSHILKTMNKTEVKPDLGNMTIDLTTLSNNTTDTNNTTTTATTTTKKTTNTKKSTKNTNTKSSSKSSDSYNDQVYDVPIPGSGGKTIKGRFTGITEYGSRYEEVGTGRVIYH